MATSLATAPPTKKLSVGQYPPQTAGNGASASKALEGSPAGGGDLRAPRGEEPAQLLSSAGLEVRPTTPDGPFQHLDITYGVPSESAFPSEQPDEDIMNAFLCLGSQQQGPDLGMFKRLKEWQKQ